MNVFPMVRSVSAVSCVDMLAPVRHTLSHGTTPGMPMTFLPRRCGWPQSIAIFAGPATDDSLPQPPSTQRRSISTATLARVLGAARGIGAGCPCRAGCGAGAVGCCAFATDAAAIPKVTARTGSMRMTRNPLLEVSLLHLGEELLRLFFRLDSRFIGGIVRQVFVVLLAEPLRNVGISAALGSILFGQRQKFAVVHDWFRRAGLGRRGGFARFD